MVSCCPFQPKNFIILSPRATAKDLLNLMSMRPTYQLQKIPHRVWNDKKITITTHLVYSI